MSNGGIERLAPLSGAAAGVLLGVGALLALPEDFLASGPTIAAALVDDSGRIVAGAQIGVVGAAALLWFTGSLRAALRAPETGAPETGRDRLAGIAGVAGATAAALWLAGFVTVAAGALRADDDGAIPVESAQALYDLAIVLGAAAAPAALAVLIGATALAAIRYRGVVLPFWLAIVSAVLAVALLILPISWAATPVGLLWLVVVGVMLTVRPADAR